MLALSGPVRRRRADEPPPFSLSSERKFGPRICFLCARRIAAAAASGEHVVSNWVQREFKLHNEELVLQNGTAIKYGILKIPCCKLCNTRHLNKIETEVAAAVRSGAEAVSKLDPVRLFVWLGKTFYGILYKELFLDLDRRAKRKGRIATRKMLRELTVLHYLLQSARVPMTIAAAPGIRFPLGSIFIYELQKPPLLAHQFNLRDTLVGSAISMQLGKVGIIACFKDAGIIRECVEDIHEKLTPHALHPIQFAEVTANVFACAVHQQRSVRYATTTTKMGIEVTLLPRGGLSREPFFREWDQDTYARFLAAYTYQPFEFVRPDAQTTWTCLFDNSGSFIEMRPSP